jgi:hypothetical protein
MRYDLTPVRIAITKKDEVTSTGEGVEKTKPLYSLDRNINWDSHYGK